MPFRLAALGLLSLPGIARESGKDLGVNDQRFLRTRHCNIEQSRFGRGVWAKPRAYEIWSETHRVPLSSFGFVSRGQDYVGAKLIGFNIFDRRPEFALTVLLHQLDEVSNAFAFFRPGKFDNVCPTVETEEFGADSGLPRLEFIDIAEKSHQLLRAADYGGPSSRVDGFQDFEDDGRVGAS